MCKRHAGQYVQSEKAAYLVLRAPAPTCGSSRSTPKGAFLSCRKLLISAICSRSMSGVYLHRGINGRRSFVPAHSLSHPTPPMTPRPPAFVTAAASLGPAATFMPASMIGWLIFKRSVVTVRICSEPQLSALRCSVCVPGLEQHARGEAMISVLV